MAARIVVALFLGTALSSTTPARAQEWTVPDWMKVDRSAKAVSIKLVAGKTEALNYWNFNGYADGKATIVVPVNSKVTITFKNDDPYMAHSVGVGALAASSYPAIFDDPEPAFAGAMSTHPTDLARATQPGKQEVVTFTADKPGEYALICYVPGHAITGMWIKFNVSAKGEAGFKAE